MRRALAAVLLANGFFVAASFADGAATGAVVGAAADGVDGAVRGAVVGGTMDALTYRPGEHLDEGVTTRGEVVRGRRTGAVVGAAADGVDGAVRGAVAGGTMARLD